MKCFVSCVTYEPAARAGVRAGVERARVCSPRTEVAAHDAVPGGAVLLVELLLDEGGNVLLDVVLLQRLREWEESRGTPPGSGVSSPRQSAQRGRGGPDSPRREQTGPPERQRRGTAAGRCEGVGALTRGRDAAPAPAAESNRRRRPVAAGRRGRRPAEVPARRRRSSDPRPASTLPGPQRRNRRASPTAVALPRHQWCRDARRRPQQPQSGRRSPATRDSRRALTTSGDRRSEHKARRTARACSAAAWQAQTLRKAPLAGPAAPQRRIAQSATEKHS